MRFDTLVTNARIRTMDAERPTASSLAIHNGRVIALDEEIPSGIDFARRIDAEGATIIPGFNDVHAHSTWFGLALMEVAVGEARDAETVYRLIEAGSKGLEPDEWVVAAGLSPMLITGPDIDRDRLDRAAGGRPVWIKHSSGHAATVNGVALDIIARNASLDAHIEGGVVVKDASGRPTGLLEETAMSLVQDLVLPYPAETLTRALDLATARYVSEGITSVTDAGIGGGWIGYSPGEFGSYQRALDTGVLRTRMQPMIILDALHELQLHADDAPARGLTPGIRSGLGNDRLSIGPVKVFTDGSLLGQTAYMHDDYVGCPGNHGYLQMTAEALREASLNAARAGWALALHAIGDHAIDHAIDIIAEARQLFGRRALPDRIEHGGVVADRQLAAMAANEIALVPQPHFITEFGDGMSKVLGEERTGLSYPARRVIEHGLPLPGSSDRPVSEGHPLAVIQAFVERRTPSGAVYGAGDRITVEQALHAYTVGSAKATGFADRKGRLVAGQLADFVVLGDDPTAVATDRIHAIDIVATSVGDQVEHGEAALQIS